MFYSKLGKKILQDKNEENNTQTNQRQSVRPNTKRTLTLAREIEHGNHNKIKLLSNNLLMIQWAFDFWSYIFTCLL